MMPRLLEVFVLSESNANNIVRLLGWPKWAAEETIKHEPKNAFALAKIMDLNNLNPNGLGVKLEFSKYGPDERVARLKFSRENFGVKPNTGDNDIDYGADASHYVKTWRELLRDSPTLATKINSHQVKEFGQIEELFDQNIEKTAIGKRYNDPSKVVLDAGSGWKWVIIKTPEDATIEGTLVGHCGAGCTHSLRDPKGAPHVTATITKHEDGRMEVTDAAGRSGTKPWSSPKYRPYLEALDQAAGQGQVEGWEED
jgi:hypothetical protein